MYLTEAARRRGPRRGKHSVPEVALSETRLSVWEERDRAHVELINAKNDATIVEWWDEAVAEAVQDGFLKPGKLHESAYDYAVHIGLIKRPQHAHWTQTQHPLPPVRENPTHPTGSSTGWEVTRCTSTGQVRSVVFVSQGNAVSFANKNPGSTIREVELDPKTGRILSYPRGARENPVQAHDFETQIDAIKSAQKKIKATHYAIRQSHDPVVYRLDKKGEWWLEWPIYFKAGKFHVPAQGHKARDPYGRTPDGQLPSDTRPISEASKHIGGIYRSMHEANEAGGSLPKVGDVYRHRRNEYQLVRVTSVTPSEDPNDTSPFYVEAEGVAGGDPISSNINSFRNNYARVKDQDRYAARECGCEHGCGAQENPVDVSDGIPWVKSERNAEDFEEVRAVAEKIGPIKGARSIYNLMSPWTARQDKEHLVVILLDIHSMLRGVSVVHIGTRDRVTVDPSDVLKPAIDRGAKGIAIMHNHPSGAADHSPADASLTKAMKQACKANDIAFVDHVVMGTNEYYSFTDKKLTKVRKK